MARLDTRQRIEEAAIAVLAESGLEGFTASRLSAFAQVSKANLYHHFASMDEILVASFNRLMAGMQMMNPPEGMGFADWLEGLGRELIAMPPMQRNATRAYISYFTRALADEKLGGAVRSAVDAGHSQLCRIIERWMPAGTPAVRIEQLARLVLVAGDGFLLHAQLLGERSAELHPVWALFTSSLTDMGRTI